MQIAYAAPDGFASVRVSPYLHDAQLAPAAVLTHLQQSLLPEVLIQRACHYAVIVVDVECVPSRTALLVQSASISPLTDRDVLISQRLQYALLLSYKLTLEASCEVSLTAKLHNVSIVNVLGSATA